MQRIRQPSTDHFISGLFILSVLFLLAAFMLVFVGRPANQPFERREIKTSGVSLIPNYTVRYPAFNRPLIDANLRSLAEAKIRVFEQKAIKRDDPRNHLTTHFNFTHLGHRFASILFTTEERIVGMPDNLMTEWLTVDLQEDRVVTFQDVMQAAPSSRAVLAGLLHDYFKQTIAGLTSAELTNLLDLSLTDIKEFSIEADALVIYINPHQPTLSTNAVGVRIEKPLLSEVLAAPYRSVEPEQTAVVKNTVTYHIAEKPLAGNTIDPNGKLIALTFDDGPSHLTPQLLDTLRRYQANATFFVLGKMVPSHADILQRMVREGDEIGNHSWGHPMLTSLSGGAVEHELDATQAAVQGATGGYRPVLMRPPYGATNQVVHERLAARGLHETLWNVDTNDWLDRDPNLIYNRIMASAADGRVVLLHDIYPSSIEAAVRAIRDLKSQGYQLVTASQLYQYR